ncbi:hypothetical protein COCC4DRAFT_34280 [Bipolaris maydis ATCC 48331]|uniref:Uncharacterized protein n=2 Tax=Cochliobolus heterostrophus TaxID=5016 RepID=M2UKD8_COCH5|nr:uncharacterized protein COCC4DRAFT_34280 [Bipolaris maydis ATCC 48331]EMD88392.1 hypothetical protein COCHEDRAFT_1022826 [Bipolaris maydis C5]KAJ5028384.1 hypothetical protein J3E73DRAFT_289098 [Bipolaris maydis]ENI00768.1 hypothetical protein COCC4DRAFT_34280 [Bipolaris maydis ATCC 48331]KAJ6272556.1 hypothetical protein PSV08DRAFT_280351 [Bipolaris maydis]KAJ6279529.1 hypothetical protein J3E71DRAFT_314716 [Bipolaris maydis]
MLRGRSCIKALSSAIRVPSSGYNPQPGPAPLYSQNDFRVGTTRYQSDPACPSYPGKQIIAPCRETIAFYTMPTSGYLEPD